MAFPGDAIDNVDLKALASGGLVNEDVANKIFRLSEVTTPFQDAIGSGACKQDYTEWAFEELGAASTTKIRVQGSNPTVYETAGGTRVGNRTQINARTLSVSSTAESSTTVGGAGKLMYRTALSMQRVRQDVEAAITSNQASVADDNNTTAGKSGGFSAWITSEDSLGTGGASGGFNTTTNIVDAPTVGVGRQLAYASMIGAMNLGAFENFGNPSIIMTIPTLMQKINQAIVAGTIKTTVASANVTGAASGGKTPLIAQGYYQVIVNDFGVAQTFVPNRLQPTYTGGGTSSNVVTACDVLGIDPGRVSLLTLEGYRVTPIVTSGLNHTRDITVQWTLRVDNEAAHWVVRDINPATAAAA
jgi:hypothetical protein